MYCAFAMAGAKPLFEAEARERQLSTLKQNQETDSAILREREARKASKDAAR